MLSVQIDTLECETSYAINDLRHGKEQHCEWPSQVIDIAEHFPFNGINLHAKDDYPYWCMTDIGWITGHSYIVYGPLALAASSVVYEGGARQGRCRCAKKESDSLSSYMLYP